MVNGATVTQEGKDVSVTDKDGNVILNFSSDYKTVTMARWYWDKIVEYNIETEYAIKSIELENKK